MSYKIAGHEVEVTTKIEADGYLKSRLVIDKKMHGISIGVSDGRAERIIDEKGLDTFVDLIISGHLASLEWATSPEYEELVEA